MILHSFAVGQGSHSNSPFVELSGLACIPSVVGDVLLYFYMAFICVGKGSHRNSFQEHSEKYRGSTVHILLPVRPDLGLGPGQSKFG